MKKFRRRRLPTKVGPDGEILARQKTAAGYRGGQTLLDERINQRTRSLAKQRSAVEWLRLYSLAGYEAKLVLHLLALHQENEK